MIGSEHSGGVSILQRLPLALAYLIRGAVGHLVVELAAPSSRRLPRCGVRLRAEVLVDPTLGEAYDGLGGEEGLGRVLGVEPVGGRLAVG